MERVVLLLPKENGWVNCKSIGRLIYKGWRGKSLDACGRNGLQNKEPIEILAQFNGEIRVSTTIIVWHGMYLS